MSFKQFLKESLIDKAIEKDVNLNEAVFSEKNLAKVMKLYSRLFSKQFESKFYLIGEENFKRASGKGVGARFINEQGYQLRFNWSREELRDLKKLDQKEGKGEALYLSSIDYWEPVNDDFGRPSTTLTFHKTLNVVQIWDKVSKLLKKGVKGKFTVEDIFGKDAVNEASPHELSLSQNKEFARKAGFTGQAFHQLTKNKLAQALKDDPDLQSKFDEYVLEITAGKPETNDLDTDLKKTKKDFDDKIYADPDLVFEDIERMVEFIAKKGSKSFICCGLGGIGKCISGDTLIASPDGNFEMKDAKPGMRVFTPKNKIAKIKEVYPQDKQMEMFEIELSDGRKVVADEDQLFNVKINKLGRDSYDGEFSIRALKEIKIAFDEQKAKLIEQGKYDKKNPTYPNIFFPTTEAIQFPKAKQPLNPYFLGLLLGDGGMTQLSVTFTNNCPKTVEWVKEHLKESKHTLSQSKSQEIHYKIVKDKENKSKRNEINTKLKELNLIGKNSHTKFIPEIYKRASIEQRMELLRGLVDTDGYIAANGNSSICTVSETMANDICEIIWSLGGRANKQLKTIKYLDSFKNAFDVNFTLPFKLGNIAKNNDLKVERYQKRLEGKEFFKKLKIKDIKPVGLKDAYCFLIDDSEHLFLTAEYVVVHNTFHITKTLESMFGEAGLEWHYHSGMKITPFTIYKTVFQERNATIVFDEADDILTNSDIVVQLKPVLDTSGKNTMEYAHGTMSMIGKSEAEIREYCKEVDLKLAEGKFLGINNKGDSVQAPSKFYFDGQMIFISNMRANKIDQAIMSRSLFIDVYLCATDINKRIQSIMKAKYKDMSNEELEEIMESLGQSIPRVQSQETVTYMTPELARKNKPVTVRSMELAIRMKKLGIPNWTRLSSLYA